jgi:hypothetical protein
MRSSSGRNASSRPYAVVLPHANVAEPVGPPLAQSRLRAENPPGRVVPCASWRENEPVLQHPHGQLSPGICRGAVERSVCGCTRGDPRRASPAHRAPEPSPLATRALRIVQELADGASAAPITRSGGTLAWSTSVGEKTLGLV